jgi:TolB-like protein/DNA-binding winged helix-turn-helix (wHTH) protein
VARCYSAGEFEIRPDERRVLVGGQPALLGARAFDLLMCLIDHRDRVVNKNELLEMVWPGSVVEENNLTVHVSALRKLLGAQAVATIPGRGYRFAMQLAESDTRTAQPTAVTPLLPGATSAAAPGGHELPLPDKPSIAVLPFDNLSGDPEQEHFIDGMIEDVITELSRFRSLFVIARNSTFAYKGRAVDVRTIGRELGVRYVVEGSIRRADKRIRVTAQLVDAPTGTQLWAEKYDRAPEDIFAVQEELTQAIVAAIAPQIESSEYQKVRRVRPGNLNAYELAMRARDMARWADKEADPVSRDEALRLAHTAVAMDPSCSTALRTIAYVHWQQVWAGSTTSAADDVAEGVAAARRAIAIDSGDHLAHLWKGMLLLFSDRHGAGLADLRRAHELNPNDALTLSLLGHFVAGAGDAPMGIRHVTDALRLSPRDGLRWSFLNSLSWAQFAAGDYASAAASAQTAIGEAPRFYPPRICLVMSRVGLGEMAQATAEFRVVTELAPQTIAARLAGHWICSDRALVQRATSFLRIAAGLEEPDAANSLR